MVNTDGALRIIVLNEVKKRDGNLFAHVFRETQMDRLNKVIVRDIYAFVKRKF